MTQRTTPNPLLLKVARLIRDLTGKPEGEILIGRQNWPQDDFITGYIVVDQLGPAMRESGNDRFDGCTEVMYFNNIFKSEITIEFYGNDAYTNSDRLVGLLRSQRALDEKRALGITVYQVSSITDVKQLTGQQYGNRLQMSMMVQDNRTVDVETLRIDEAQYKFLTEDKEIEL